MNDRSLAPSSFAVALALVIAGACQPEPVPERRDEPIAVEPVEVSAGAEGEVVWLREGFSTPESAVWDPDQDVYFVSNVNGGPTAKDDNGYISRVDAATGEIESRWIDGSADDVTLHGPRGLSVEGDVLWAVDVDALRWFDKRTGESLGEVAIPNSYFLNDAFATAEGSVYVSDSGMPGETEGESASVVDAVYRVTPDRRVEQIASGQDLHRPDGLWQHGSELWVTAFGSREVYRLENGAKADVQTLPSGVLDGLMWLEDGTMLVSSWDADGIFRGRPGGPWELVVEGIDAPADFGLDAERGLLIVPHFQESVVSLHPLGSDAG